MSRRDLGFDAAVLKAAVFWRVFEAGVFPSSTIGCFDAHSAILTAIAVLATLPFGLSVSNGYGMPEAEPIHPARILSFRGWCVTQNKAAVFQRRPKVLSAGGAEVLQRDIHELHLA